MTAKIQPINTDLLNQSEAGPHIYSTKFEQYDDNEQVNIDQLMQEIQPNEEVDFRYTVMTAGQQNYKNDVAQIPPDKMNKRDEIVFSSLKDSLRKHDTLANLAKNKKLSYVTKFQHQEEKGDDSISSEQFGNIIKDVDNSNSDKFKSQTTYKNKEFEKLTLNELQKLEEQSEHEDDRVNRMMRALGGGMMKKIVNISEFFVHFHVGRFIKVFFYHWLFFFFGPLTVPLIWIFDTKGLSSNMGFWIPSNMMPSVYLQYIFWFINLGFLALWGNKYFGIFSQDMHLNGIYVEQFLFYNISLLIRSFIIAVRYGYSSNIRYKLMSASIQETKYLTRDLMLAGWVIFSIPSIEMELESVMWRNQIEECYFKIHFLEELQEDYQNKLKNDFYYGKEGENLKMSNISKEVKSSVKLLKMKQQDLHKFDVYNQDYEMYSIHKPMNDNYDIKQSIKDKYKAKLLIREIALFSGSQQTNYSRILLLLIFGRLSLPFIARYFDYGNPVPFQWDGILYSALEFPVVGFLSFANYLFVIAGFIDFQRRVMMMKACSALLNPFKNDINSIYQIFPTINHTCKRSLHTWFELRMCLMDFGRKYMNRIFIYSSTFMACYLFFLVVILLEYFELVSMGLSLVTKIIALYDVCFVLGVNLLMLNFGAQINYQFIEDRLQLVKLKQSFLFIKMNMESVVDHKKKFSGPYLKMFQRIFKAYSKFMTIEQLREHTVDLIDEIDAIMERLDIEGTHKPLKLLGLQATYQLMNTIYTTLLTIIFAVAQKLASSSSSA